MADSTGKPLIIQSDASLMLDVHDPSAEEARAEIGAFSELEKSPEHIHTYRITPLSLWNASSAGFSVRMVLDRLLTWSRYGIPQTVEAMITDQMGRFGTVVLTGLDEGRLLLSAREERVRRELGANRKLSKYLIPSGDDFIVDLVDRGTVKQELIRIGYPVKDEAPLREGEHLDVTLRGQTQTGHPFTVRDYQADAARSFTGRDEPGTGFGTVVLPCGSGKTIVGIKIMELLKTSTLIITTNIAAVHQWIEELTDKTTMDRDSIGEYTGDRKEIKPITIATYQILTWRPDKDAEFPHFSLFHSRSWGLVIYDEVHLLPAPVFRVTAELQAMRRLGLTATLIREDGREEDVFALIGPKRYDVPWKELEAKGWIAEAYCNEIRIDLPVDLQIPYAVADKRGKFRIASENPDKIEITREIIANHREDSILVIGQYLDQLDKIAETLGAPLITGRTPNVERERIYGDFKRGIHHVIVVSKVANFAIDLPDASVAIQISGTFGSRQEEAQRLGRILRPKKRNSYFYSVITRYTVEESFAANRQKFLTEQGYKYQIDFWENRPAS